MSDPFRITGPTCISFSGGRTSAYMLWRVLQSNGGTLPPEAVALFANTGKEEEATLRFVDRCSTEWGVDVTWLEYTPKEYLHRWVEVNFDTASRAGQPFKAVIKQRGGVLPNPMMRYCSSELKTRTMHRYLRSIDWTEWTTLIGIRADEPRRVAKFTAKPYPETKDEEVLMPLATAGIGAQDIAAFWRAQSFDLELPNMNGKTMHGNCDLCMLKPAAQIASLIAEKPERAVWWAKQEAIAMSDSNVGSSGSRFRLDRPGYAAMALMVKQQHDFIGHDEDTISCFCGD